MRFCTAINCMDGRTQQPVADFLRHRFHARFVDTITEPGPNRILAERRSDEQVGSILGRVEVSVTRHGSRGIAVVGHHDCAGNPTDEPTQKNHLREAAAFLADRFPDAEVIGLWVDASWQVHELPAASPPVSFPRLPRDSGRRRPG